MSSRLHGIAERAGELYRDWEARYVALNSRAKVILWIWVALHVVGAGLFWLIGWENIFAWMARLADNVRELRYGWLVLFSIVVVTSIPPLIGYGTAQTLIGFAFGVMPGFFISAASCLVGGVLSFVVVRKLVRFFAPFIHKDKTFKALSNAVRVKGLPLIVLLRLCPFPYPYSNAFFASVESVTLGQFFLATLAITPKLLLHVFIGHRTYLFADPESRHRMDPLSRWINLAFMVFGSLLGFATSWYLYRITMRFVEEADLETRASAGHEYDDDLEAEGTHDGVDGREGDLEVGLLGRVDEFLDRENDDEARAAGSQGSPQKTPRDVALVDIQGGADEDSLTTKAATLVDLGDEDTSTGYANAPATRRDSEAWGLDFDADEEATGIELPPVKKRID
ncbi:hypothetical protein JCM3766R1_004786 [Sporobolomyces carnicolor]